MYKEHLAITQDDIENLTFLKEHPSYISVIKLLERVLLRQQEEVLKFNLNEKTFAHLGMIKAKADGAAFVIEKFKEDLHRLVASNTGEENERRKSK